MIDRLRPYRRYSDSGLPWLGQIPLHWEVQRNGRLFQQRNQTGFAHLPILEVSLKTGVRVRSFDEGARKQVMSDRDKYKLAARGDIAYNMMRMWQGAVGPVPEDGLVSPAYVVARPNPGTHSGYFSLLFRTSAYMNEVDKYSRGVVKDRNRLYWEQFKQMPSVYPPPEEQAAIARFLDHVDRRIRRSIRAKQKLIALLEELKAAIIHRAVTRGLDPNVRLKPSGVEWLGDVPEHWEVVPLRRVITRAVDGPHHSPRYLENGIPFLSARNIKTDRWSLGDVKYISHEDYAEFSRRVVPEIGDVLYTKGGTTGIARVVDLVSPFQIWVHVAVLKVRREKVAPGYLAFALNSPRSYEQAQLFTRGATNQDLGLGRMKGIVFALPPASEQDEIVEALDEWTRDMREAAEKTYREIDLLKEYRTRLIADVVTGKLDVRGVAARLPDEPDDDEPLDEAGDESVEDEPNDDPDSVLEEDKA